LDPLAASGAVVPDFEARIQDVRKRRWIRHADADRIHTRLEDLYRRPPTHRPDCALIFGEPNAGKTATALRFAREIEKSDSVPSPDQAHVPIIYMVAPPYADVPGFYDGMLRALKAPTAGSSRAPRKWQQLLDLIPQAKTRMVIIDEVQNLRTGRRDQQEHMLNAIKNLASELHLCVVALGTEEAVRIFQTDQQLGSRFPPTRIQRWQCDASYAQFVASCIQGFRLKEQSDLGSTEMLEWVHRQSEGLTGETWSLLTEAAVTAIRTGRERITVEMLKLSGFVKPGERRKTI